MHPKRYSRGNKSKKMDLFSKGLQATVQCVSIQKREIIGFQLEKHWVDRKHFYSDATPIYY